LPPVCTSPTRAAAKPIMAILPTNTCTTATVVANCNVQPAVVALAEKLQGVNCKWQGKEHKAKKMQGREKARWRRRCKVKKKMQGGEEDIK
jgi:hypothetical protein